MVPPDRLYLTRSALDAQLARRDEIVEHFDRLIRERGEAAILFSNDRAAVASGHAFRGSDAVEDQAPGVP